MWHVSSKLDLSVMHFYSTYPQRTNTDRSSVWTDLGVSVVFCKQDQDELMDL